MYIQNKHRKTYSAEFKLLIVNKYLSGEYSIQHLSDEYDIIAGTLHKWVYKYKAKGVLKRQTKKLKSVSFEILDKYIAGSG